MSQKGKYLYVQACGGHLYENVTRKLVNIVMVEKMLEYRNLFIPLKNDIKDESMQYCTVSKMVIFYCDDGGESPDGPQATAGPGPGPWRACPPSLRA